MPKVAAPTIRLSRLLLAANNLHKRINQLCYQARRITHQSIYEGVHNASLLCRAFRLNHVRNFTAKSLSMCPSCSSHLMTFTLYSYCLSTWFLQAESGVLLTQSGLLGTSESEELELMNGKTSDVGSNWLYVVVTCTVQLCKLSSLRVQVRTHIVLIRVCRG